MMGCSGGTGEDAAAGEAVHVALGRDLNKGKVILDWVFKNLRSREVVVVHVHKPPTLIPMKMGGKFPIHMAAPEEAESYIAAKREKMNSLLHGYMRLCAREKIFAKNLVIETDDVFKGIVYLVGQHQIQRLVMGLRSIKGQSVLEEGLLSCQIWLVHNGRLAFARKALLQQISIEFTGDGNQGNFTSSPKSAKESSESHQGSAALKTSERWTECTDKFTDWSSEAKEAEAGLPFSPARETEVGLPFLPSNETETGLPFSPVKETEAGLPFLPAKETETGLSKEESDTEDIRDLLVKLGEAVHVVYQQRLELARQIFELKQEFIEFSLPELEEAANQFIAKNEKSGRG